MNTVALLFNISYKRSARTYCIALCTARLSTTMLSLAINLACVKTDVVAHKMIQNCGLVYSIGTEKLQLILQQQFIQNIASDQIFISCKWYH